MSCVKNIIVQQNHKIYVLDNDIDKQTIQLTNNDVHNTKLEEYVAFDIEFDNNTKTDCNCVSPKAVDFYTTNIYNDYMYFNLLGTSSGRSIPLQFW